MERSLKNERQIKKGEDAKRIGKGQDISKKKTRDLHSGRQGDTDDTHQ